MGYDFDRVVDRRGTFCTQWDYMEDRFGERGLLPFSISDTDFMVPEPIRQKLHEVVGHGIYGYSRWNHGSFKGAVAGYFAQRHGAEVHQDQVVYSPSVLYSIAALLRLLSERHGKVLAFEPMYDAFYHVVRDNLRELVPMRLTEDKGYEVDFVRFEELVKGCRVFLLCSPHNPTGRVWTREEVGRMVGICRRYQVPIISDEIHSDMVLAGHRHHTILNHAQEYGRIYLVSSSSKTFNTPGLVGSYAVLPDKTVREAFVSRMRNRDFLNSVSLMGMHAMMTGYGECMDYAEQMAAYIQVNMECLKRFIDQDLAQFGVRFSIPEATYLAWIDVRGVKAGADAIQDALVHVGKVGIMPGGTYGDDGYLRMNLGCPEAKLRDGMGRMKKAFESLGSGEG